MNEKEVPKSGMNKVLYLSRTSKLNLFQECSFFSYQEDNIYVCLSPPTQSKCKSSNHKNAILRRVSKALVFQSILDLLPIVMYKNLQHSWVP